MLAHLQLKVRFKDALNKQNFKVIKQICYGLEHLIGFSEVRKQYLELKLKLELMFERHQRQINKTSFHSLEQVYKLPSEIGWIIY